MKEQKNSFCQTSQKQSLCFAPILINPWIKNVLVILKWTPYVYSHTFGEC